MHLLQVSSEARTSNLAQASQTRLSESGGGSPKPSLRAVT